MNEAEAVRIAPLTEEALEDVIRIHRAGMGYSLNSRLGHEHMRFLYQSMAGDPDSYVGVAHANRRPVGVISGSIDADRFMSKLLRGMPAGRLARTALKMLTQPGLIWLWWKGNVIGRPVRVSGAEVKAVLTAIVVDANAQNKGTGRALVRAFEDFLRLRGVGIYRLDTKISNEGAGRFYGSLGFQEIARRADSIIFVRQLT